MAGYIKLYRQLQSNKIWSDKPFSKGQAWIDLLLRANYITKETLIGNTPISINRGSFLTSILGISNDWGWSEKKVSNFFNYLQFEKQIVQERKTKFTLITICKYDDYQCEENNIEEQKKNKRRTKEEQKKTTNNSKNIEEGKEGLESKDSLLQATDFNLKPFKVGHIFTIKGVQYPIENIYKSFTEFLKWIDENAPAVSKLDKNLTFHEFLKIRGIVKNSLGEFYSIEKKACYEYLLAIENNKEYLEKYRSPYLCILNWDKRNKNK